MKKIYFELKGSCCLVPCKHYTHIAIGSDDCLNCVENENGFEEIEEINGVKRTSIECNKEE